MRSDSDRVRLAEIVAALSLGIDLGFGQPMEHVLRQCLIALRLAERIGLDDEKRSAVYYTALLVNVGCHTDAHEQAKWFGDDIAIKSRKYDHEPRSVRAAIVALGHFGAGHPLVRRLRLGLEFAISGRHEVTGMIRHHAEMASALAQQLGLRDAVLDSVSCAYEQWDGKGWPGELRGEEVPIAARISQLAEFAEVAHRVGGVEAVRALARKRRGRQFDPHLADVLAADAEMIVSDLADVRTWDAVIDIEPSINVVLTGEGIDHALDAVAGFVDLKSPYFLGHARAVADLAGESAALMGMPDDDVVAVRRSALVSGFGRLGVSNAIWDKRGSLGAGEWERVRMHPYLTERMLQQSAALAPLGGIAVQLRERADGTGYPHGLSGAAISRAARVLAAADAYHAMRSPRPYREPRSAAAAAAELRAAAATGAFDDEAVRAVLATAGHRVPRRRQGPAGLTAREIEVLCLVARGMTNKDIAAVLTISPKTVANHVEHIYTKIGATGRARASLFAVKHGLLPQEEPVEAF